MNCEFFFYRKDIFEKYNLEAPTTWNEFLDTCKTLKDNGEIPLIVAGKENWQLMRYLSFAPWRMTKDQFIMDYIDQKATFSENAAAKEGAEHTADCVAKYGRAKNYGEQSLGVKDAGACSIALIFQGLRAGYNA